MEIYNQDGVKIEKIVVGDYQVNCYILTDERENLSAVIDPGNDSDKIEKYIDRLGTKVLYIINTHGHFDHIMADNEIRAKYKAKIAVSEKDAEFLKDPSKNLSSSFGQDYSVIPDIILREDDVLNIGGISLKIKLIPGHTPGGLALANEKFVFSGDSLFSGSIGRTDFPGGDSEGLIRGIKEKLLGLDDCVKIFPGHGPATTVRNEKIYNPFLKLEK